MEEILEITLRSIIVSLSAILLSATWSIPITLFLSRQKTRIANIIMSFFNSLVGIPTVIVGLFLYMILSSSGPLGFLRILYTPHAIIIGQSLLITPWIVSLSYEVFVKARNTYWELALALGADYFSANMVMLRETLPDLLVILLIAFSRAVGELGVALLVGGNIRGYTRVLTTTIALAVSRGEFEFALALGAMLVFVLFMIALTIRLIKAYKE